ncbi:gamma-soluble NSF attachment protein-like [Copidosoma floridanum]|uniref:gamma-soluble NSF attachment protein-like n=1 Tax=Copidosoma floridanum TaxID=29053 RepID=UPI0006C9685F|nr:gamma-soluble NSF attachment protein-like [Copidosoma floridanum]
MSKIEEANAHIRQAEKSLKTGLLKWRPDFDVAADEYTHAATCFRVIKNYEECKECLLKAADCYKQNRSWFHAAKNMESVILVLKEMNKLDELPRLAHSACSLYQQHGSPESGASVLDKAGKILEQKEPEKAMELYKRAADICMGEDSPRQAAEYMSKVARFLVRLGKYDEAADAIRREINMHQEIDHQPSIGRLAVALVLVQLARGDQVAAEKAFKEWGNYCDVPEIQTLQTLLEAYDYEDADGARAALNSPFIKHMDTEYAKLARGLPLPQQEYTVSPAGVRPNAAPSYVSPNVKSTVEADVNREVLTLAALTGKANISEKPAKTEESQPEPNPEDMQSQSVPEQSHFKAKSEESQLEPLNTSPSAAATSVPSREEEDDDYEGGLC